MFLTFFQPSDYKYLIHGMIDCQNKSQVYSAPNADIGRLGKMNKKKLISNFLNTTKA